MSPECRNCGAHVSEDYARVYGDGDHVVHHCLHCDSPKFLRAGSSAGRDPDISESIRAKYTQITEAARR